MIKTMERKKQIFTHQEKKKFLEILKNYSKEVENKHTHSSALKAKNLAWMKITHEFNSSPQTDFHRTPKQLRRLWMNMKQRQREAIARTLHLSPARRPVEDIISGSNVLQIAQALMNGDDSSVDSDIVIETIRNTNPVQSETSLCLSEESQNISNQETPVISTVKIEPMSPIIANPGDTLEATPRPIHNSTLTPNNKAHITKQRETFNEDAESRLQSNSELQALEIQLLKEKVRSQRQENTSREAHAAAMHNLEYQILKEKLREAKAKADLAELYLRRQYFSDETIRNTNPVQSETSLCLSEESQNISNQETPVISTVKIEPMSPIIANPGDTLEATPRPIHNSTLTPNNKAHITKQRETFNEDAESRLQSNSELQALEIQLLKEKVRSQRQENTSREAHAAAMHNLEYQILKEKLREAKAKADLAELYLRRQYFSDD